MIVAATVPLLQAPLAHAYYGGPFAEFAVRPLPATAAACRNLGLRLLQDGATLTLAALADATSRLAEKQYRARLQQQAFVWEIAPLNPHFPAFTGVDVAGPMEALVLAPQSPVADSGRLTCHAEASVADVWARQPLSFDFQPTKPLAAGGVVTLETAAGEILRRIRVVDPRLVKIDVSQFGSGLYRLAGERGVLTRWFADERAPLATGTGPVLVLPGSFVVDLATRAGGGGGVRTAPSYSADFPTRPVVWRYHVFTTFAAKELAIAPIGDTATATAAPPFRVVPQTLLPGAVSFEATHAWPLSARAPQRFALRRRGAPLYTPLPLAGFDFARPARGAAIFSDIFVHL
ncbi:MAG: hypothetical protein HYV96_12680 [Opitutae bacterium]|nr:hypothetical protein [Opitutae bacterium]